MRVKISANPPLPPVRAWFPLALHGQSVFAFKVLLCTSLPAFCDVSPGLLCLSIDGFELLDNSELSVVRDGDLISIDVRTDTTARDSLARSTAQARLESVPSRKRKHRTPTPSLSNSESESTTSESESESETSDSDESELPSLPGRRAPRVTPSIQAKPGVVHPSTIAFVPPGYGKPQTRSRNLRRRLKRIHSREAANVKPVSGANAIVPSRDALAPNASGDAPGVPALVSLSLRNKNKAKNFKSFLGKPLPPKIIFGEQDSTPKEKTQTRATARLIPPSQRSSLPPNLFVTSMNVEHDLHREKKMCVDEYDRASESGSEVDVDQLESFVNEHWATLEKPTCKTQIVKGTLIGYKGLGIDPATNTPGQVLTVGRVVSCDESGVVVRTLRPSVSFSWRAGEEETGQSEHVWAEIVDGWRLI